ncbi:peptide transporter family 1 isoform X3 [Zophobas morio]|uniref:peptide transporter family 1 isoform X3 n=1 Tax=Zophobas morio TaxID=2755281 RepID=UPI003082EA59
MGFMKEKKVPYPKSVFFIVSNELCERFSYYGMRTILSLYLRDMLLFSESDSKIIYHTFAMLVYFFPIFGAILSDSYLGKFRTILYVSVIYACGNILLALASAEPVGLPQIPFSMVGLFLIALGTGGIKPCVSAFGGDQFVLPQQELQLAAFFSMFYFAINAGSLISTFLTPVLREDVHCFDEENCYPLAFAIPGVLMVISIVIFAVGKPLYKIRQPEGNVVVQVMKCIGHGIKKKFKSSDKVDHWLDRSEKKYGQNLVTDVKTTLKVLVLFVPLPIFWALYDQQGSGWTFQAARMDGNLGGWTILPDQMQVINPLLILIFIPLFTYLIYPGLAKCNLLKTPLQRMVCGGLLTAGSFAISAGVSFALEATYPVLPDAGECQIRMYNPLDCNATFNAGPHILNVEIKSMGYSKFELNGISGNKFVQYNITGCDGKISYPVGNDFAINDEQTLLYYMTPESFVRVTDDIEKDEKGLPKIRTLVNNPVAGINLTYLDSGESALEVSTNDSSVYTINPGTYKLNGFNEDLELYLGGVYTVLVSLDNTGEIQVCLHYKSLSLSKSRFQDVELYQITAPNSVHMLWLIPQYVVITAGEIMFSITGLEFSYSQAPVSMKSVLTAAFLLTTAVGNLIIVIIESAKIFEKQSYDFLLYAGLMIVDMILFAFMAMKYKYINVSDQSEREKLENSSKQERKESNAIDNPAFKNEVDDA